MPAGPRPRREGGLDALARAAGVTRVARLTGLDRTGVEVASAVRPGGHVLQVGNGKGERWEDATLGALMEAAELHAAERARADAWESAAALCARLGPGAVVSARALDGDGGEEGWDRVRLAWREAADLAGGARVLVPAHAVYVPPADGPFLGPALLRWTSNGMGAAPSRARALLHGLLEAIERDRVARALPEGFTQREIDRRLVAREGLEEAAPRAAALARRIEERGFRVYFLDLTEPSLPLPTAAAVIVDREGGPVPVAAGYATRLSPDAALRAALLEAAQSRATEIHGAREDVLVSDRHEAKALGGMLARARAGRGARRMPALPAGSPAAAARAVVGRLRAAGLRPLAADLEGPPGVAVVKVLVPGLLLSELL